MHASKKECRQEINSRFETREEGQIKSKPGTISGSTNLALVQQNFLKKSLLEHFGHNGNTLSFMMEGGGGPTVSL